MAGQCIILIMNGTETMQCLCLGQKKTMTMETCSCSVRVHDRVNFFPLKQLRSLKNSTTKKVLNSLRLHFSIVLDALRELERAYSAFLLLCYSAEMSASWRLEWASPRQKNSYNSLQKENESINTILHGWNWSKFCSSWEKTSQDDSFSVIFKTNIRVKNNFRIFDSHWKRRSCCGSEKVQRVHRKKSICNLRLFTGTNCTDNWTRHCVLRKVIFLKLNSIKSICYCHGISAMEGYVRLLTLLGYRSKQWAMI